MPCPCGPSNRPWYTQTAMPAQMNRLDGIGRPSKYLLLPVSSLGTSATVALNRARRAMPAQMKSVRRAVSIGVRRPRVHATKAGATPNEICGRGRRA